MVELRLSSVDRTTNSTSQSDFFVQLPQTYPCSKIQLVRANIPNVQFNVTTSSNTMVFSQTDTSTSTTSQYTVTIPSGAYSSQEFLSWFNSNVTLGGVQYQAAISATTFQMTISQVTSGYSFTWTNYQTGQGFPFAITGFQPNVALGSASSQTGQNAVNFNTDDYFIQLPSLATSNINSSGLQYSFCIPNNGTSGTYSTYLLYTRAGNQILDLHKTEYLNQVHVRLVDRNGNPISTGGLDWTMAIDLLQL